MAPWRTKSLTAAVAGLCAALGLIPSAPAMAQHASTQHASTMIVLDGSNSMNARLPGDKLFKHVTVREALRAALANGLGQSELGHSELGLTTFGARRSSDCTDVEVAVPPSPDGARVLAALERFQPRGFSPVVLALRTAAKALPTDAAKASIVLVLDDLASCRGEDPCKVAAELKQQNPALAIHVVGLALRPQDQPVLACVAKETGGQMFNAADAAGVAPALEQALRLASIQPQPVPAAPLQSQSPGELRVPVPTLATPPTAVAIDERRPGVHFTARLNDGGAPLAVPVRWRVWPEATASGPPLIEATAPLLSRPLPDGRYVVEAHTGLVTVRRPFEVASQGATPVRVVLDAALLSIAVPLANGSGPADTAVIAVGAAAGQSSTRVPLWLARAPAVDLVVPAGDYTITAEDGLARAERTATVAIGATSRVEVPLGAGRLLIEDSAVSATPAQIIVEADDPDSAGGRREVHRSTGARLSITLPAGTYLVTLRRGAVEHRERVPIRPGETAARNIAIPLARVRLVNRVVNPQLPVPLSYRIERLDAAAPLVQRWSEPELLLDLTPGRYRFEARAGSPECGCSA